MFKVTFFQVFLNKHLLSGSRKIPGNNICNPAFPGITKWLYRGNTDLEYTITLSQLELLPTF
jgi:hypothetical protein